MSKKKKELQRKYLGFQRKTWGFDPTTRIVPSKKVYKRNREKRTEKEDFGGTS